MPYMFHVERGQLSDGEVALREQAAVATGAVFVHANLPGGWQSWFEAPNRGEPFDRAQREETLAELERLRGD